MHIADPHCTPGLLPPGDDQRALMHNEVHARPAARIQLPAWVISVTVLNDGVSREQEWQHLRWLPGQHGLPQADLQSHFVRLRLPAAAPATNAQPSSHATLTWERHTEFTRYALVQPMPEGVDPHTLAPLAALGQPGCLPPGWLAALPGRTVAAIELLMLPADLSDPHAALAAARAWFGNGEVTASLLGTAGHSLAVTDFALQASGFERIVVFTDVNTSPTRAGRISQRLLEMEIYRLMALRGLPVAKSLGFALGAAERELADTTAALESKTTSDQQELDALVALAARIELAIAEHGYRFDASRAYDTLVRQRLTELRERPVQGTQMLGEFLQRRFSPAMATVAATAQRLSGLSERVARTSALLRTRVDIATESQNQQLLSKLTRGQEMQLRLQTTVEGLSIAAISYYVVSLLVYGVKALKAAGLPLNVEITTGALVPLVLWGVWQTTRRIHQRLQQSGH